MAETSPGNPEEVGQVYGVTLTGLHPHQSWSHILLSVLVVKAFLNFENKGVSYYLKIAPAHDYWFLSMKFAID